MSPYIPLALLASHSMGAKWSRMFAETPFAGIHQLAWFDWAMLIPYFTVLIDPVGIRHPPLRNHPHLFQAPQEGHPGALGARFEQLPPVTIQLPLYNERYVVERLIEEVLKMEYPRELLQIQVLDDSTDDTAPFAEALVERYRTIGLSHRIPSPLQPPRVQGRRAAGRAEDRDGRTGRGFRRRFLPARRLPDAHRALFRRSQGRRGADALELSQPRLQLPHRSGSHAAGRPFHPGARRAVAPRATSSISTARRASCARR